MFHRIKRTIKFELRKVLRKMSTSQQTFGTKDSIMSFGIGMVAGAMGSLAGLGGSFVAIPLLISQLGLSQHIAQGTSMASVLFTSAGSIISYSGSNLKIQATEDKKEPINVFGYDIPEYVGDIHIPTTAWIASSSTIMAVYGARLSKQTAVRPLRMCLGIFQLFIAPVSILRDSFKQQSEIRTKSGPATNNPFDAEKLIFRPIMIGIGSGLLAGFFGVGGGAVVVPALITFTDLDYKAALATSLGAMFPTAVTGSLAHYGQGTMLLPCAIPLGAGCLIGSYLGAKYGKGADETHLKYGFTCLMTVMGSRTLYQALRMAK